MGGIQQSVPFLHRDRGLLLNLRAICQPFPKRRVAFVFEGSTSAAIHCVFQSYRRGARYDRHRQRWKQLTV